MTKPRFFALAAVVGLFAHDGRAQTKLNLTQLPGCVLPAGSSATTPVILALLPNQQGATQFACYALMGVTVQSATATSPAAIVIPSSAIPSFMFGETPAGTVDGTNTAFTLQFAPFTGSLQLYRNGELLKSGVDYTSTGSTIKYLANIPQPGDIVQAAYLH